VNSVLDVVFNWFRAFNSLNYLLWTSWLNWIEQPPPKGQVTGSNPVGVTKNTYKIWLIYRALCRSLQKVP
jgi:hypothetical protein